MTDTDTATVLVVDDDPDVTQLFADYLEDEHEVRTAQSGGAALEQVDADVNVVILDRRMPGRSGDDVLEEIRTRGLDCRVVMVTAVDPDFDIIDMGFDDYLVKPVTRQELEETISHLLTRQRYSALLQEYFGAVNKIAALESTKTQRELEESEKFAELEERADQLRTEVTEALAELDDFVGAFHEISRSQNVADGNPDS